MKSYIQHIHVFSIAGLFFLFFFILITESNGQKIENNSSSNGVILGHITRLNTGNPLSDVTVSLSDTARLKSDQTGHFRIDNLIPGSYILNFSHVGLETEPLTVLLKAGDTLRLNITMHEIPVAVDDITVLSNRPNVIGQFSLSHHSLTQSDLAESPKIGEDIFRSVTRVPGVASNDFSATFKVRGGEHDQVLVLLDGLELYEPFHIKDVDGGILSIIDMDIVESIDLSTGAFSAAYGNHLSGVFNIRSKQPEADKKSLSTSIDFFNARCLSSGTFNNNQGFWLVSARRGYFDLVSDITDNYDEASPAYYDFFVKGGIEAAPNHPLTANLLYAHDDFDFTDDDGKISEISYTTYNNTYSWLTLNSIIQEKLLVRNIIYLGNINNNRKGYAFYRDTKNVYFNITDSRSFGFYGFKQDHILELSPLYSLHAGININFMEAEYDYFSVQENRYKIDPHYYYYRHDTLKYINDMTGRTFGAYLSNQIHIAPFIKTVIGLRYDHPSYIGDDYISPRINAVFDIGKKTSLHCGWGYFYQPQALYELAVADDDTTFYPAERAEHYIIGLEKKFTNFRFSLEGYYRKTTNLRPDYRNFLFRTYLYREANFDRVKLILDNSRSKGLELLLKNDDNKHFNWQAAYVLSYVREKLLEYTFDHLDISYNKDIPGEFDQRHTLFIDLSYKPSPTWKFALSWEYHSGWPFTKQSKDDFWDYLVITTFDDIYEQRLPVYHRMDFRINRLFNTSKGRINIFLEIINLYDHDNIFAYKYDIISTEDGNDFQKKPIYYLHFLPSLGVSWKWEF